MTSAPPPDLLFYGRADCGLCAEARSMIQALLADRHEQGLRTPTLVDRDIDTDPAWQRAFFAVIPVVELGAGRLETVTSLAKLRRLLAKQLDGVDTVTASR